MDNKSKKYVLTRAIELKKSIKKLKRNKDVNGFNYDYGLCSNIADNEIDLNVYFKKWKHFSGSTVYPVTLKGKDAEHLFEVKSNKYRGKYGKKRINLLKFIIKSIKKDLK